jgi:TIR domain
MTTYFLSYARADDKQALRFADDLIAAGVSVWVDQYDILPSQHWDKAVETAVRGCDGMIVILSPRSVASPNVADEISVAIDDKKAMIPVLIEACQLPLRMTRMQFIDATRDYDAALRKCLASVVGHREGGPPKPELAEAVAAGAPALPDEVLAEAERRLTGFMGPIAKVLVRAAAGRVSSKDELYRDLAKSLPNEAERTSFLSWLGETRAPGQVVTPRAPPEAPAVPIQGAAEDIPEDAIKSITLALTRHMGPIAGQLVARERKLATNRADLCQRLAQRIAGPKDRAAFLSEVGAG